MRILGIETSCDDTCAALVESKCGKFKVLKNIVSSQVNLHKKYGGIVPEIAARKHVEQIIPVINEIIRPCSFAGGRRRPKIDAIAVTSGPGLITSLHVGVQTAKTLSYGWDIPLVSVNHIEGHIYSTLLSEKRVSVKREFAFPAIALIVSGGHTELILMRGHGKYRLLGRTRDDAAGEAFDKTAVMLNLGYPGGPEISKRAAKGNPRAFDLPRPMLKNGLEFSFSGLKNAVRLSIEELKKNIVLKKPYTVQYTESDRIQKKNRSCRFGRMRPLSLPDDKVNDLCASIEQAIIDVLAAKSLIAVAKYKPKTFILAGGVSANKKLRKTLRLALPKKTQLMMPELKYTQDNAAMIATAAYRHVNKKKFIPYQKLSAKANWELA